MREVADNDDDGYCNKVDRQQKACFDRRKRNCGKTPACLFQNKLAKLSAQEEFRKIMRFSGHRGKNEKGRSRSWQREAEHHLGQRGAYDLEETLR